MKSKKQLNHSSNDLSAREDAYNILSRLCGGFTPLDSPKLAGKQVAHTLIENHFRIHQLHKRDKGLLSEIVYGVIRHVLTLDYIISSFSNVPFRNIHSPVVTALRIGAYQLVFLDKIPPSAAVNESVKLVKRRASKASASFTNAVLRAIARSILKKSSNTPTNPMSAIYRPMLMDGGESTETLSRGSWCYFDKEILPNPLSDEVGHIATGYSHPRWLVERWLSNFDEASVIEICKANNSPPPIFLRVNILKTTRDELIELFRKNGTGIVAERGEREYSIRLVSRERIDSLPGYYEGLFQVQDESAIRVAYFLGVEPGERVLDLCAAPGGKTTHIAEMMKDSGEIVAVDVSEKRLMKVKDNCNRLGIKCVKPFVANGTTIGCRMPAQFDRVLVDVPCSNTGVLRRRVEARWRLTPKNISSLSELQYNLIKSGFLALKHQGTLVYSTCSLEPEENEEIVARLQDEKDYAVEFEEECRFLPQLQKGDGGYVAKLRKL